MLGEMAGDAKKKQGSICEDDISLLLQRYTPSTVLALLQEISHHAVEKIEWRTLVKSSSTGISNPKEYQMLWRHLAYSEPLLEKIEDGVEPLDDDSDLEHELEAHPAVNGEAALEAAACVKVLKSSALPNDSSTVNRSAFEAPLTISIPNGQTSSAPSDEQHFARSKSGVNIITLASIQKQRPPARTSADVLDGNGSVGEVSKKKRKTWSKDEDKELIAAVQKYGEGNWATILKEDFKHDRTAQQLSQRWSAIRRKCPNTTPGSSNCLSGSTQSETMLATRNAVSMALNMPIYGSLSAICSGGTQSSTPSSSLLASSVVPEASTVSAPPASNQTQKAASQSVSLKGSSASSVKSRTAPKKLSTSAKPSVGPNPLIQAAAFAAGGRIANPSTAASLLRAAQSRNAVHIRPGGRTLPKASVMGAKQSPVAGSSGNQAPSLRGSKPIVPPPPSGPRLGSQQVLESSGKPPSQATLTSGGVVEPNLSSQQKIDSVSGSVLGANDSAQDDTVTKDHKTALDVGEMDMDMDIGCNSGHSQAAAVGSQTDLLSSKASDCLTATSKEDLIDPELGVAEEQLEANSHSGTQTSARMDVELLQGDANESHSVDPARGQDQSVAEDLLDVTGMPVNEVKETSTRAS